VVLESLRAQFRDNFEVIIADDGSALEVVSALTSARQKYPFKMSHIWHPDLGFRKTVVLNRAVLDAETHHLIFLDGDCVPQQHFVEDHLDRIERGVCNAGRRIDVFYSALDYLDRKEPDRLFVKHWLQFAAWSLQKKARNVERGIRLPRLITTKIRAKPWSVVGCNFSVHRQDLIAINGFDERAPVPWGAEDSDINRRLLKAGVKLEALRYQAPVIHFDASFENRGINKQSDHKRLRIFLDVQAENRCWTPYGIIKEDRPDPVLYRWA
jgi:GT2 family glycosyltransferase